MHQFDSDVGLDAKREELPAVLFDGYAVYETLKGSIMSKEWEREKYLPGDKEITIFASGVCVMVDHDDCDHDESEMIANFIVATSPQYEEWKVANFEGKGRCPGKEL